jgi:Mn2+/Fe2+ NRAMP family transporter
VTRTRKTGTSSLTSRWAGGSWRFNCIQATTLVVGVVAAASDWPVVSVVILAQVVNGILLPFLSVSGWVL